MMMILKIYLLVTNIMDSAILSCIFYSNNLIRFNNLKYLSSLKYLIKLNLNLKLQRHHWRWRRRKWDTIWLYVEQQHWRCDQESLPSSRVYCQSQHMPNLNLNVDEPSSYIFYNSYIQLEGELKVGDKLVKKEVCVRAIKKFHMKKSTDFTLHHTDARRYVILFRNELCMFRLT